MKRVSLLVLMVLGTVASIQAQKVKYKDLHVLLNAKDYDQAMPFLRKFLIQDPDHPNANFNMALYYEHTMGQMDMLKEAMKFTSYGDSCYTYFEKSYALINEKEVRKNDEYYQEYYRRDLRTGKYGVKLADVQLDVEEKMAALKVLLVSVRKMSSAFELFVQNYDSANSIYNSLMSSYSNYKIFLFNSGENELNKLSQLGNVYAQSIKNFSLYESYNETIENSPHHQVLAKKIFEGFKPVEQPDYFAPRIDLVDYVHWADYTGGIISTEIIPISNELVDYDTKLDAISKEAVEGNDMSGELETLSSAVNFSKLKNYDNDPLPINLFSLKEAEIKYNSRQNRKKSNGVYDSLNLDFQYIHHLLALDELEKIGRIYEVVRNQDLAEANKLYSKFITVRYTNTQGLMNAIGDIGSSLQSESERIISDVDDLTQKMKWATMETDTLPMTLSDSLAFQTPIQSVRDATVWIDTLISGYWIGGFRLKADTISTYVAKVSAGRNIDTLSMQLFVSPAGAKYLDEIQYMSVRSLNNLFFIQYGRNIEGHFCRIHLIDKKNEVISWSKQISPTSRLASAQIDDNGGIILQFMPATTEDEDNGDVPQMLNLDPTGTIAEAENQLSKE